MLQGLLHLQCCKGVFERADVQTHNGINHFDAMRFLQSCALLMVSLAVSGAEAIPPSPSLPTAVAPRSYKQPPSFSGSMPRLLFSLSDAQCLMAVCLLHWADAR